MSFIDEFLRTEAADGVLLAAAALLALIWTNSPWRDSYREFLGVHLNVSLGQLALDKPLLLWINDALMAIFFLVVGVEIKREIIGGELSTLRQATQPCIAALGVVVPALIYAAMNWGDPVTMRGWAIPAATDIAFSLGVLALVGQRAPGGLKVFLLALAIFDDLAAIVIIAIFYTADLSRFARTVGRIAMKRAVPALVLLLPGALMANALECEVNAECPGKARLVAMPYAFYNDTTGFAAAAAAVASGYLQPQVDMVVNVFAGTKDSLAGFLFTRNYQMIEGGRWFLDLRLLAGHWAELKSFQPGNPAFPNERAGSNDSSEDDFIEAEGTDQYYRATLRYVVPIGDGARAPIHVYRTRHGLLEQETESGGREWNPWQGGITTFEVEPFYRKQLFDNAPPGVPSERSTAGLTLRLKYDNTDWPKNPSRGSRTSVAASRDWGAISGMPSWSQTELEYAKYFSLGETPTARQRVLAFVAWTSDVPTWDNPRTIDGQPAFHRPPVFAGSTLGGLDRQRGFEAMRFNDKAAINYQLEYRHIPVDNPLAGIRLLEPLQIRWVQYTGFVELGRVAPTWRIDTLHQDMKSAYGIGARVFALGIIGRIDLAFSKEGSQVQMFIGQAF